MLLKVKERLMLVSVITPLTGGFAVIEKKIKLKKLLEMPEGERKELNFEQTGGIFTWDGDKDAGREIDLKDYEEVLKLSTDTFKAFHEERQDWSDYDYESLQYVLSLLPEVSPETPSGTL